MTRIFFSCYFPENTLESEIWIQIKPFTLQISAPLIFRTLLVYDLHCYFYYIIYTLIDFFTSSHFWLLAYIWCSFVLCWTFAVHVLSEVWWSTVLQIKSFVTFAWKSTPKGILLLFISLSRAWTKEFSPLWIIEVSCLLVWLCWISWSTVST